MLLFHYTTEQNKAGIFESGEIRPSAPGGLSPGWVSLTSDTDPVGHGLPDGRPISWEQAEHLSHEVIDGLPHCWDHTKCRLTIEFEDRDPNLVWAISHHSPEELQGLEISAYHPVDLVLSDSDLLSTAMELNVGMLDHKARTWWYYKTPIPTSRIAAIEVRDPSGRYVKVAA